MSGKNKHRNSNDYLRYLKGELSGQERHAFERGLEADPFEEEAMEGLESLSAGQAEEDLLALHNKLRKRLARRRRVAFYSVAATVASLLIVGTVFLKVHDFDPGSQDKQAYPEETQIQADQEPEPDAVEALDFVIEEEPYEEVEMEVSQMAAPIPEAEDIQEEEITYMEAEPLARPDEAMAARPDEAMAARPDEAMEARPDEAMAARPDEAMAARPDEAMKARPDEVMAARPVQETVKTKKSRSRIVAGRAQETPEMALTKNELEQMLTGKVTGIVVSAEDQGPIPGAIVMNRELESGVYTDLEGRFGIPVKEDSPTTLVTSFIGMETQEHQVEDGAHLKLVMQADAATLNEVLVVGYVAEREDLPVGSSFDLYQAEEEEGLEYKMPEPSIGFKNYRQYIEENIRYPEEPGTKKEVVVLRFTVTREGEIEDVLALRSPGASYTEEATRLLMNGPVWNPASNEEGTKNESVRMRIVFKK